MGHPTIFLFLLRLSSSPTRWCVTFASSDAGSAHPPAPGPISLNAPQAQGAELSRTILCQPRWPFASTTHRRRQFSHALHPPTHTQSHTILLLQPVREKSSRTFYEYPSVPKAVEGKMTKRARVYFLFEAISIPSSLSQPCSLSLSRPGVITIFEGVLKTRQRQNTQITYSAADLHAWLDTLVRRDMEERWRDGERPRPSHSISHPSTIIPLTSLSSLCPLSTTARGWRARLRHQVAGALMLSFLVVERAQELPQRASTALLCFFTPDPPQRALPNLLSASLTALSLLSLSLLSFQMYSPRALDWLKAETLSFLKKQAGGGGGGRR